MSFSREDCISRILRAKISSVNAAQRNSPDFSSGNGLSKASPGGLDHYEDGDCSGLTQATSLARPLEPPWGVDFFLKFSGVPSRARGGLPCKGCLPHLKDPKIPKLKIPKIQIFRFLHFAILGRFGGCAPHFFEPDRRNGTAKVLSDAKCLFGK